MKVERRDGSIERKIVTGLVTNRYVLAKLARHWREPGLCRSRWANIVGSWAVEHYNKTGKAPRRSVELMFENWAAENQGDGETVALVEKYLASISDDYAGRAKKYSPELIADMAEDHFRKVRLERLRDMIEQDIEQNALDKAEERLYSYKPLDIGSDAPVDVLNDKEAIRQAFAASEEVLLKFRGDLGKFMTDAIARDTLYAILAPEKRGKSFVAQYFCWLATQAKLRTAMFQIGDMSKSQIMKRFAVQISGKPLRPGEVHWPTRLLVPSQSQEDTATIKYKTLHFDSPLDWSEAWTAFQRVVNYRLKTDDCYLKLVVKPNYSFTVLELRATLKEWSKEGWLPELVCVDYADLFADMPGHREKRDQIDANWKHLKAISQEFHCCVLTATQAKAESYSAYTLSMKHFSDDKRKNAHVDGIIGINQTDDEKVAQVARWNWIVRRNADFSPGRFLHVAECRPLANVCVVSKWDY